MEGGRKGVGWWVRVSEGVMVAGGGGRTESNSEREVAGVELARSRLTVLRGKTKGELQYSYIIGLKAPYERHTKKPWLERECLL